MKKKDARFERHVLRGTTLVSTNGMYGRTRSGGVFLSKRARVFGTSVRGNMRSAVGKRSRPYEKSVWLRVDLRFKGNRRRDVDNVKLLLDALEGILYVDDSQITRLTVTKEMGATENSISIRMRRHVEACAD